MRIPAEQLPAQGVWIGMGLLLAVSGALVRGNERGLEMRSVFALTGAMGVAGLVGARLFWVATGPGGPVQSGTSWSAVYTADGSGFASFGGLFAVGVVAWAAAPYMSERSWRRHLDTVVPAGFVGLAAARVGCLAAGCDFGRPTDGDWGLLYPVGTPPHTAHVAEGWIDPAAAWSLPVHPFPLYLVGVTLLAVFAGSRFEPDGAQAVAVPTLYCVGRFVAESFRSTHTDLSWVGGLIGSNQLWAVVSLMALGFLVRRRRDRT